MSYHQQAQAPFQQQAQAQPAPTSAEDLVAAFEAMFNTYKVNTDAAFEAYKVHMDAAFQNLLEMFNTYKVQQDQQLQQAQLALAQQRML